ncbi:hypothetical protein CPAST_c35530 [Clostridium pasteurianum DSM 525 = ATCC 6013]|uniref:Uncharacterized protein n=1 Tax=Clostridium pasteurianum DSM 525 = ATCC 6013 TaxID=1262449 RepID=A0A0H3J805_CLOPA|nr:hypothetical protein [Clostridium pasteurianum]AJA49609.1 hypothetical protein CPAST_c35530 [Clostridium pasteurianum DSM 525 = ATCC 6013]AJA53597.1 hypothetical protein CLPA_c35530 [Clostridium pasteurianum DSM 525 = ATCC 6013]AOZ76763.1 hypothetical protein AQ983_17260 [Clostridium pasteurianum DSM 525 = ATCC 6013]AOZ80560.1 hypothetical protein AQ984_17255 [Clostridium pasteurianum]ELP58875.1 hypothetical protein F502_12141 [Clostridium pasteurianum DSM 525 = ATCC 6013]
MIKKNLNIVIISITILTVLSIILIFHFSTGIIDNEDDKTLILNNKSRNNLSEKSIRDNISDGDVRNNENLNKYDGSNKNITIYNEDSKDLYDKNKTKENNSYSYNKENSGQIQNKKDISVFKVSKEKIIDNLSISDKVKIFSISKSLSHSDLNRLQNDINNNDEKRGISDAMYLLKAKLDNKDFNVVKDIASKFINLDSISN